MKPPKTGTCRTSANPASRHQRARRHARPDSGESSGNVAIGVGIAMQHPAERRADDGEIRKIDRRAATPPPADRSRASTSRPPGSSTRWISDSARGRSGTLRKAIAGRDDIERSAAHRQAPVMSPTTHRHRAVAPVARFARASAIIRGVMSSPEHTSRRARAAANARSPVPQARSSARVARLDTAPDRPAVSSSAGRGQTTAAA